jgi:hypothetical protein
MFRENQNLLKPKLKFEFNRLLATLRPYLVLKFYKMNTVAFLFLFDKYNLIID